METAHLPNGKVLQVGKYKIVRFIGSGGFGCTYEGEHTMLQRRVAIKEFFVRDFCNRDETTSHVSVGITEKKGLVKKLGKKFVEEARFTARMRHPNIARVSDVFEENGTAYYVMDYMDGPSLDRLVKTGGPMAEARALRYIRQVASALAYVHKQNRLHLDVKPGNIMTDEEDNAILIDFGASKQYDEVGGENTSTLMGKTPGYAPIEQMGNTVTTFSPATDIYALGATLYKLLTGITPPGSNLLASGEELAPLPSNVSASTANAVYAAMRTARKDRPQNVADFLVLLESGGAVTGKNGQERWDDATQIAAHQSQGNPSERNEEATELNPTKNAIRVTNGHEYIDLGLSVKWATCNVGAATPSDYGNYYAWGETETKDKYKERNSLTRGKKMGSIAGNPQYDAATANWGGTWRMPTYEEMGELIDKCNWKWAEMEGHKGYEVTGPNGRSIFLPAAGWRYGSSLYYVGKYGFYWSAAPREDYADSACYLLFYKGAFYERWSYRSIGQSVRPVSD